MTHVVTQACCGDASCVFACPVNAIHPTPDEPDFGTAEMLYIDPVSCVDCGACVSACPVGAISAQDKLAPAQLPFVDLNAMFHAEPRERPVQAPVPPVVARTGRDEVRIAIVGSGPAALYAADELLKRPGVRVTVLDRLPTPYGLVRAGVAPDHRATKSVGTLFRQIEDQDGFSYALGVEVGRDITPSELAAHHHAVIYATGASLDRRLGIEGEDLPGSATATAFVAWYNGHPDHAHRIFDLSAERAVIVGTGNVALDVARILATDPSELAATDIAEHALDALRDSAVREIVLLGRRGAAQAAFTLPELIGLVGRDDIEFVVEGDDLSDEPADPLGAEKISLLRAAVARPAPPGARRIVFRFATSPRSIHGRGRVESLVTHRNELDDRRGIVLPVPTDDLATIETGLVLRSIGYRGAAIAGLPFDQATATIPHITGRVDEVPGTYVVGWIKRGPHGFIGTNKSCARETVDQLITDLNAGVLPPPSGSATAFDAILRSRVRRAVDLRGWRAIDRREREEGARVGRPRRKLVAIDALLAAAEPAPVRRRPRVARFGRSRAVRDASGAGAPSSPE
ncbi:MAG: 4Fe-4S binding protein [Microbacterium sp.]